MPRARVFAAWVPIAAVLLGAWPAAAFHTVFDYAVERFEADGNAFGPSDGVPDLVDEFDDGSLAPLWALGIGTAEESNGALHLKSPGVHVDIGYTIDVSEVTGTAKLVDGGGDFTITSTWNAIPGAGDFIHMSLFLTGGTTGPDGWEFLNLLLHNTSDGLLWIYQSYGKGYAVTDGESTRVSLGLASAGPVFRIAFDDDTNLVTLSLSLDGGVSFMTPFAPHVVFDGPTEAVVLLGADPSDRVPGTCCGNDDCTQLLDADADTVCDLDDNCPSVANATQLDDDRDYVGDACDPCTPDPASIWKRLRVELLGINDDVPGNETVRLNGVLTLGPTAAPLDPPSTGVHVQVWNPYTDPVHPIDVTVPGGMKSTSDAGWTVDETGTRFVYEGGAARVGGIRRMTVKQRVNGSIAVKLAAPKGSFQVGATPFPTHASIAFGPAAGPCAQTQMHGCTENRRKHLLCDYVWPIE